MTKIALGTVQFGLQYGINNYNGVPTDNELKSIFDLAFAEGIKLLDTAQGYGNAEERLGNLSEYKFDVVTKFKKLDSPFPFISELKESLKKLNRDCIYGYMAHDADLLIKNPDWWLGLQEAKSLGIIKNIGYSLYTLEQLDTLIAMNMFPDIIQIPFNILDRRFECYFSELKKNGVEIHTRSVFLQGLFFMKIDKLPIKLRPLTPVFQELQSISNYFKVPLGTIALKYVTQNPYIDKVLIGVDSKLQLEDNLKILKLPNLAEDLIYRINKINVQEKKLLSPVNW